MHFADGTTSKAQHFPSTAGQDRFQVMYYNELDTVATSFKDLFNQSSFAIYQNIESLLFKIIKREDTSDKSEYIKRIYNDEINITQSEIEANVLRVIFYEKKVDSFLSEIQKLPRRQSLLLTCIVHMCKLFLVNPATTSISIEIVFHCKKNKNLNAFQNDPSEIQCVVNFVYTQNIDRQFKFKGHCKYFLRKKFSAEFKFDKRFNFLVTFMVISFILIAICKY